MVFDVKVECSQTATDDLLRYDRNYRCNRPRKRTLLTYPI